MLFKHNSSRLQLILIILQLDAVAIAVNALVPIKSASHFLVIARRGHHHHHRRHHDDVNNLDSSSRDGDSSATSLLDPTLTENRIQELYAWVHCAMNGDDRYEDLLEAVPAIFGQGTIGPFLESMKTEAMMQMQDQKNGENRSSIMALSQEERERNTLGPLGAGQWSGQHPEKFAHSVLLLTEDNQTVKSWIQSLPRKCRKTIRKSKQFLEQNNWTYSVRVIKPDLPAPHCSYHHFRCVLQHEIRLATAAFSDNKLKDDAYEDYGNIFFNAILEGIERFVMSLQMTGSILEYRNGQDKVVAFCHMVAKGTTLRGQWFYASDEASRVLIWFHSVWYMVQCSLDDYKSSVTAVDLGPNGLDGQFMAHANLKQKYGFDLYEDWPRVASYRGSFWSIQ